LGNLAQRSLSMIAKNCEGRVPACGEFAEADQSILDLAAKAYLSARVAMDSQAIHTALAAIFEVVSEANRYFAAQEPWALRKTDFARMETVLYVTAEILRQVGILIQPFMPDSAAKLLNALAVPQDRRQFVHLAREHRLVPATALPAPEPIFPRYLGKE
jgi:methionyl-tRNA synthetase